VDETRFHRHWYITVREQGRIYRFLRKTRRYSTDRQKVEASIFAWGVNPNKHDGSSTIYTLSILGVLHGLTGLTLYWEDSDDASEGNLDKA
jgi:hypothetical protein